MLPNKITEQLNITYPIIQAPMAGGITTTSLIIEVAKAGGLGMIGAGYLTPEQTKKQIAEIKQLIEKPFGINLFTPQSFVVHTQDINQAMTLLDPICKQLKLDNLTAPSIPTYEEILENFQQQIEIVIAEKVPICSFTFGIPSKEIIEQLKEANILLIGTATTLEEAKLVEEAGFDMVVLQGQEAGGHRGSFTANAPKAGIDLNEFIRQTNQTINIPIIASGGIMDKYGIETVLELGADAVQMGTAFLTCDESGAHPMYKSAIIQANKTDLQLTCAFSGKWAQGIQNDFMQYMEKYEHLLPPFPVQNALTQSIRKQAALLNNTAYMSLWSGHNPQLAKQQSVKALMDELTL